MKLVRISNDDHEPLWDEFSFTAVDFRPQLEGDFVNVFTTIRPKATADETKQFAIACTRELASWVLTNRRRFNRGDRFQIIVGWPKSVRPTGRQIVRTGGGLKEIEDIASKTTEIRMHGNWTANVFKPKHS